MSQLLKAEFLRLVSRRLTWILLALTAILAAIVSLNLLSSTTPLDAAEQAAAQRMYEQELAWCEESSECEPEWMEQLEPELFVRYVSNYGEYIQASTVGALLVGIAAVVLAASLIGSEFTSGSISTQLTFTPRRMPVMAAKVAAATAGAVGLMVAYLLSTLVIGTIAFMLVRGSGEVVGSAAVPLFLGRIVVATFFVALLASLLTFGMGASVMSVGAGTVLLTASFLYQATVWAQSEWAVRLLPTVNLEALVAGSYSVSLWREDWPSRTVVVTYADSLLYAGALVLVVGLVSALAFKRRDLVR